MTSSPDSPAPSDLPAEPAGVAQVRATVRIRLGELIVDMGRPDPVLAATRAFLDVLPDRLGDITNATDNTSWRGAAHTLAGSAETLGVLALGKVARDLMGHSADIPSAALSATLVAQAAIARQVLEDYLSEATSPMR